MLASKILNKTTILFFFEIEVVPKVYLMKDRNFYILGDPNL